MKLKPVVWFKTLSCHQRQETGKIGVTP